MLKWCVRSWATIQGLLQSKLDSIETVFLLPPLYRDSFTLAVTDVVPRRVSDAQCDSTLSGSGSFRISAGACTFSSSPCTRVANSYAGVTCSKCTSEDTCSMVSLGTPQPPPRKSGLCAWSLSPLQKRTESLVSWRLCLMAGGGQYAGPLMEQ